MRSLRPTHLLVLVALVASACADSGSDSGDAPDRERVAFLTLMGDDTLAVEWIEFGEDYVQAESLVRGSTTTWGTYLLATGPEGEVTGYESRTWAGGAERGDLLRHEYLADTDSGQMMVTVQGASSLRAREFQAPAGAVPFVDMLHWPFESAFRRQASAGLLGESVETFNGMSFAVERNEDGSWALIHPSRGPSTVVVGQDGEINALNGTGSTRAYQLERMAYDALDKDSLWDSFGSRPLGELSGRGEVATQVAGINFTGDYGTPELRGREIFGALLAYGDRWRTGANRATHLSFDGDIVIEGQTIPAGDYTLYSIPEENGATLIINRQTGQNGTSYDESMDEARVQMTRETLEDSVEVFEIAVVEDASGDGGRIELRWGTTAYVVGFSGG